MFRFLLSRLANEKVIEYLSQTYVIRRAAQMTVSAYYRLTGDANVKNLMDNGRFRAIFNSFKTNLKKELEDVQREIKSKNKK